MNGNTELIVSTMELGKSYSKEYAIKDCNLTVAKGSIYGLLGANGAGKTTLFKILAGLISPSEGKAEIFGLDVVKARTEIQGKIGTMIDLPVFYENLSGAENLKLHLSYMEKVADVREALEMVGLDPLDKRPASKYSLGMRQRLAIARAIVHKPKLLILDEPTNGLDPAGILQMRELFLRLAQQSSMTIFLSSHILSEIEQTCDVIAIIKKGHILCEDTLSEIERQHGNLEDYYMEVIEGNENV